MSLKTILSELKFLLSPQSSSSSAFYKSSKKKKSASELFVDGIETIMKELGNLRDRIEVLEKDKKGHSSKLNRLVSLENKVEDLQREIRMIGKKR